MRVYLVVHYHKKEKNMTVVAVYLDKAKAKARVSSLESDKKRKDWYNIIKYDVEDALLTPQPESQETKAPES